MKSHPNNRFERIAGRVLLGPGASPLRGRPKGRSMRKPHSRWAKEGIDDWDKVLSFDAGEAPRRST